MNIRSRFVESHINYVPLRLLPEAAFKRTVETLKNRKCKTTACDDCMIMVDSFNRTVLKSCKSCMGPRRRSTAVLQEVTTKEFESIYPFRLQDQTYLNIVK